MESGSILFLAITGIILFATQCQKEDPGETVHIPDQAFLEALIAQGIDGNGDGIISYTEAEQTQSIVLGPLGITDLTGLEAFVNLDSFSITLNPLLGLDLTRNVSLRYLSCESCELTTLNLEENGALQELNCGRNIFTSLDVSNNISLKRMTCNNNLLTTLDLSKNLELLLMISCGNRLTSLDLSANTSLTKIGIDNMPMLENVCVWTLPFPPDGVGILMGYSPNVKFTTDCN
jgi:hypothetical protein